MRKKEFLMFGVFISLLLVLLVFAAPSLTTVTLTSSSATNTTAENLTVTTDQDDNASVKLIYNWYSNDDSIAVLNMPMDGGSDNSFAKDYSGYDNNISARNGNPVWNATGGYDGFGAFEFDGHNNDFYIIDGDSSIDLTEELTISMWVKPNIVYPTGGNTPFINRQAGGGDSYWFGIHLSGKFLMGSFGGNIQGTNTSWTAGQWYHVAGTYRDLDGVYSGELYINGVEEVLTVDNYDNMAGSASQELFLGGSSNSDDFNGTIDEVMIFNRTLSQEQILALYENKTDLIVSQETTLNDVWNVTVTPNDGSQDGTTLWSNTLTILEEAAEEPEAVPEFSDYAIALLLLTVVGGFFFMRKK